MDYKKLVVRGISYSQSQSGAYALLLEHPETSIKLPVVIGNTEAQSISIGLEKDIQPPRPLTHDIFAKFIKETAYRVDSVLIYQIIDGVFFSTLIFKDRLGNEISMDARTSDAVAMAVRFDAPIYTTDQVLGEAGIVLELEEDLTNTPSEETEEMAESVTQSSGLDFSSMSTSELEALLDESVREEDYELAAQIQEELNRRNREID